MISQNILYSKAALSRILGIKVNQITHFQEWTHVIFYCIKGKRPTLISKKVFKEEFLRFREAGSEGLEVTQNVIDEAKFWVFNPEKNHEHLVTIYENSRGEVTTRCSCEDYENQGKLRFYLSSQIENFSRACKHQIAVISRVNIEAVYRNLNQENTEELEEIGKAANYDLFGW